MMAVALRNKPITRRRAFPEAHGSPRGHIQSRKGKDRAHSHRDLPVPLPARPGCLHRQPRGGAHSESHRSSVIGPGCPTPRTHLATTSAMSANYRLAPRKRVHSPTSADRELSKRSAEELPTVRSRRRWQISSTSLLSCEKPMRPWMCELRARLMRRGTRGRK